MIDHARTEALIASSIDAALPPDAQAELVDHLASCPACRSLNAAYRSDAAGLRAIAFVEPPARVRSALKSAVARPARRTIEPWKLFVAAALLLAALLGVATAIGGLKAPPQFAVVAPSAAQSARPRAVPIASASAAVGLTVRCGPLEADRSRCLQLVGFAAGGLSSEYPQQATTVISVDPGTLRNYCATEPCVSAPPNSFWVTFTAAANTWESIPVAPDGTGWQFGIPDATEAPPGADGASQGP
jgi:hypothetical protein